MRVSSLEKVFRALHEANARYLVVGGLAVVAHGYVRLTQDLDLVFDLQSDTLAGTLEALRGLGYRPSAPVGLQDFADPVSRSDWIANKNMQVFNLISEELPDLAIDVFVKEPFDFAVEFEKAGIKEIASGVAARVVDVQSLIEMKNAVGRDQDRIDVAKLQAESK